jgi:hypothetical protein
MMDNVQYNNYKLRCEALVIALVGREASEGWWNSRNKAFDMLTAKEAFEQSPRTVYTYLINFYDYTTS